MWILALAGLSSCQKEPLSVGGPEPTAPTPYAVTLSADEQERLPLLSKDYTLTHEELLARGEALIQGLADKGAVATKSSGPRTIIIADSLVGTVRIPSFGAPGTVTTPGTKNGSSEASEAAEEQPTKIYLLNFGEGEGFAYIAGDRRVQDWLLAWADEGATQTDTDNPGMRLMQGEMQTYVESEIARLESMRGDSIYEALCAKVAPQMSVQTKSYGDFDPTQLDPNDPYYIDPSAPEGSWENPRQEFIYGLTVKCPDFLPGEDYHPRDNPMITWRWTKVDQTEFVWLGAETRETYRKHPLLTTQWG